MGLALIFATSCFSYSPREESEPIRVDERENLQSRKRTEKEECNMKRQCQNIKEMAASSIYLHFFYTESFFFFFLLPTSAYLQPFTQAASYLTRTQPAPGISALHTLTDSVQ